MRFIMDEVWEVNQAGRVRQANVKALFDDGRIATLAFTDGTETLTVNRSELSPNWRRVP
jgi:hypothetical protein